MKMQDEPLYFTTSSNEMTIVSSKMAPIQVVHIIYVIALKSPGVTLLCYCSVRVDASSIDKDSMTSLTYTRNMRAPRELAIKNQTKIFLLSNHMHT